MENKKKRTGFTLAETLIVVAILMVLAALAFIGVNRYMRSLAQLEYDAVAKEIYVVAQNHLTMAKSQGFLSAARPGTPDPNVTDNAYYYYVVPGDNPNDNTSGLGLMLPFGSIDEYVRSGSYVIRYNKKTAEVLDVFYSNPNGRHGHSFDIDSLNINTNYTTFMQSLADVSIKADGSLSENEKYDKNETKESRRNYNGDVLGYYGGLLADGPSIPTMTMKDPTIDVRNKDKLTVKIENNAPEFTGSIDNGLVLQLHIKGKTSGNEKIVTLLRDGAYTYRLDDGSYEVVLDDITAAGKHFYELCGTDVTTTKVGDFSGHALIPGEEIELWATCDSNKVLVDRQGVSERDQTNSLYGKYTVVDASHHTVHAEIAYIRHLENLSRDVSSVGYIGGTGLDPLSAEQTSDLSWAGFLSNTNGAGTQIYYGSNLTSAGTYLPVTPGVSLRYNGNEKEITGIRVNTDGDGGVFATLLDGSLVQNLKILNALISADGAAGSLVGASAGITQGISVSHVQVYNDPDSTAVSVHGKNSTGGLVGSIAKGTIECCFASVYAASGNGDAGGLVGSAANVNISSSYSGGHTQYGQYVSDNVSGTGNVGGLIGALAGGSVTASYSTCSVNGTAAAGGLIGKVSSSVTVSDSYAVGKVAGSNAKGALIGSGTISSTSHGNYYLRIINGELDPGDSSALRIDQNLDSYKKFFGNLEAKPYDDFLVRSYQKHFGLKTVSQLTGGAAEMNRHVGDWPAPEVLVPNTH